MVRTRAEQPLYSPLGGGSAPYHPPPRFLRTVKGDKMITFFLQLDHGYEDSYIFLANCSGHCSLSCSR